jgi:hypothetical protein
MGDTAIISFNDIRQMSAAMGKDKLFGKTADQLLPLMLIAQAEGLHPAIAAMEYDIIQGKPAIKSQAALARFVSAAVGGKVEWVERTDIKCKAIFYHPACVKPVTVEWTIEKAKRMGLADKDNWKKQPGIMLQWRVVAEGVRLCFPACLSRMYLVEEVQDFEPMRNVTPTQDRIGLVEPVPHSAEEAIPAEHEPAAQPDPEPAAAQPKLGQRIHAVNANTRLTKYQLDEFHGELSAAATADQQAAVLDKWEGVTA